MPTSEPSPQTLMLIQRMAGPPPSHRRFTGEPIDLTQLDALALGDLWAVAHATERRTDEGPVESLAIDTARAVLQRGRDIEPVFRGSACRDYLDLLACDVEATPDDTPAYFQDYPWENACFVLARCIDLSFDGLAAPAKRFLAATNWQIMPQLAVALARLVDPAFATQALEKLAVDLAGSPLLVAELRASAALDIAANIIVADVAHPNTGGADAATVDAHHRLSDHPGYVAFAEAGIKQAAERVRKIHQGALPYAADKAFTLHESAVIARLARVGLDRDAPWMPAALDELFRKVSLAPTAAKTVPSQSVAIALGQAVEAFPTPEAVASLRGVLHDIRHAGVKKKLQRNLRGAERGLSGRPEIALRLPLDQPVSKQQLTTLSRCLEACLALGMILEEADWRARLAGHAQVTHLTTSLLWRILDTAGGSTTVLPRKDQDRLTLEDVTGATVSTSAGARMTLWHPADATAEERILWRDRLATLQIKQPFKQAFREHYTVPPDDMPQTKTAMFSGHIVSIGSLLGLSHRERWRLDYDCLARSFGPWTATLDLADHIFPGCLGATIVRDVSLYKVEGKKQIPVRLDSLPKATLSEILRAVDLLVSVSGFAVATEGVDRYREAHLQQMAQRPLSAMAEMRKQALQHALRGLEGMADIYFDARHLRLGPYAIHLATGRVTCDGEPVTIDAPKPANIAAVPWLPYDEKLLETISYTALEIAGRIHGKPAISKGAPAT